MLAGICNSPKRRSKRAELERMAGWGRRAAGKIDRTQFGQDELLQTLGGQFNVDFTDYEQWKRTSKPKPKMDASTLLLKNRPADGVLLTVGRGNHAFLSSASTCHSRLRRDRRDATKQGVMDKAQSEKLKIIELRLKTRRKTLEEYKRRQRELLVDNMKLREEIDHDEETSNDKVKNLLRKYERYKSGISNLSNLFMKEVGSAQEDLKMTKRRIAQELSVLEKQVEAIEERLHEKLKELQVLQSYKDKEYPVKAMRIGDLQKELEELNINNQEDQEELEHIIRAELDKFEKKQQKTSQEVTEKVTELAIDWMHPSLKDMALQNMVMKKEVEFHTMEQEQLREINFELKSEVKKLLQDPKTNMRYQLFPEFFSSLPKCTPEMEVVLDIPTQQWLPI